MTDLQRAALAYSQSKPFLDELRKSRDVLTHQQLATLKGLALAGDLDAAEKGLATLKRRLNL